MDVFILLYLSFKIYTKAQDNGEKPWVWVIRLATLYVCSELLVGLLVLNYFGMEKIVYAVIPALGLALLSSYYVFQQLNKTILNNEANYQDELKENKRPNLDHFR